MRLGELRLGGWGEQAYPLMDTTNNSAVWAENRKTAALGLRPQSHLLFHSMSHKVLLVFRHSWIGPKGDIMISLNKLQVVGGR